MKVFKKTVGILLLATMLTSASGLNAAEQQCIAGCGYQKSCCGPALAPSIALGAIALAAIIAVAIQNTKHGHAHNH